MLSFRLKNEFVDGYAVQQPPWGFPCGGGNSLGEITYLRTYSRTKTDGDKERWHETVRRVVEGCYSIQRDWCLGNRLPWSDEKAQRSAQEMYDHIFNFRFLPPGRGLWMMGTPFVHERGDSTALMNCAYVSTEDPVDAAAFLMEASMLGVGVGFGVEGAGQHTLHYPIDGLEYFIVPDSREGWVESVQRLLSSYFEPDRRRLVFDYSRVRPAGEPIRGFGGVAAGPEPLRELHESLRALLDGRPREALTATDIVDVMNLIGKCVVAGNVRRSAEIALGPATDEFMDLKDPEINPSRQGWAWTSNNSVIATVGDTDYEPLCERAAVTSEPGVLWLDLAKRYGRLVDPPDTSDERVVGVNPCGEQQLESYELCNLVETFPTNHDSLGQFQRTLKFAYLYAKTVTLLPTHWERSNAIMLRNRRIGCSMSGLAQFVDQRGWTKLRQWMDAGYESIRARDRQYSEWLTIRPSVRMTSVKPSGSVSLLAGATPGVHWPESDTYIRRIRFGADDFLVAELREAGYHVEPDVTAPENRVVVELPVVGEPVRGVRDVTMWEKTKLAVVAQRYWADNSVSVTLSFDAKEEGPQLASLVRAHEGQLKSLSFQPIDSTVYPQLPYERADERTLREKQAQVGRMKVDRLIATGRQEDGERYCDSDSCEL